jgi:hypothetical protein
MTGIPTLPNLAELSAQVNRAALDRLVAGSLTSGLLTETMTAAQAVNKYFEVLAELMSRQD